MKTRPIIGLMSSLSGLTLVRSRLISNGTLLALVAAMARIPRSLSIQADRAVHKVWRGHNREPNLGSDENKSKYLEFLNSDLESEKYEAGSILQALTLMTNHTHELFYITKPDWFSNHMRRHHSRYGMYFNRCNERCGKVAQDRAHTTLLESDQQEMETVFYIHANPVRANMVRDARDYYWSTHKLYAFGKREAWMKNVILPDWYKRLGKTAEDRQRKYRRLFARYLQIKGRFKQHFLRKRFFGSPVWCDLHETAIKQWRADRPSS